MKARDLEFLNMLDPAYFDHVSITMGNLLASNDEEAQYAAIALRTAYSHSLETLFALIGAAIQAHQCVAAWLVKYKNSELEQLVRKLDAGMPVYSRLTITPLTWHNLAEILSPVDHKNAEKNEWIRRGFGKLWRRLAKEFLAQETSEEYNSIKHGLRISQRGFSAAFGLETISGQPAPSENMRMLANSKFGNTYHVAQKLHDGRNFRLMEKSYNWNPYKYVYALQLISMSVKNVISTLKTWHGIEASSIQYHNPTDEAAFNLPWSQLQPGLTSFNVNPIIEESWIEPMSKEDILASYRTEQSNGDGSLSA